MSKRYSAQHVSKAVSVKNEDAEDLAGSEQQGGEDEVNVRIAKAGKLVREEAMRLLALEKVERKGSPLRVLGQLSATMTLGLSEDEKNSLIEIMDDAGRTVACMSAASALRQKLPHRLVALALRRKDGRLILHRRSDSRLGNAGCWDIHTDFLLVGEACEDAAIRVLERTGLGGISARAVCSQQRAGDVPGTVCYFVAELPAGLYPLPMAAPAEGQGNEGIEDRENTDAIGEVLEVDADELAGITAEAPELFSRELLWAAQENIFFGHLNSSNKK